MIRHSIMFFTLALTACSLAAQPPQEVISDEKLVQSVDEESAGNKQSTAETQTSGEEILIAQSSIDIPSQAVGPNASGDSGPQNAAATDQAMSNMNRSRMRGTMMSSGQDQSDSSANQPGGMSMGRRGGSGMMMSQPGANKMCCGSMGSMMGKPSETVTTTTNSSSSVDSRTGHVLHLGEQDFYLDLQDELTLTAEQIGTLAEHRTQWLSERAEQQNAIDQAEAELWRLTQALAPDPDKVAAAVSEVERLRSAQRLAFIESVTAAVRVLTPAQIAIARGLPFSDVQ